jgi:hypothetical protein
MADTLASNVSASFIIIGDPIYKYGMLAGTYSPGDAVYESSAGTWTHVDADTAATLNYKPGIVGYKERILSTGAKSSIDSAYATTDTGVPILIGFHGYGEFVCHIEDPAADVFHNARWCISDTEGVYEALTAVAASAAGDTEAQFYNIDQLESGDTYAKMGCSGSL